MEFEPFYRGGGRCVRWMSRRDVHARCFKRRPTPTIERFDFGFRALSRLTFDFSSILISRRRLIRQLDQCSTSRRHPTSKMSTYHDLSDLPICPRRAYPSFKMCRLHLKATLEFEPFYRGGGGFVRWMFQETVNVHDRKVRICLSRSESTSTYLRLLLQPLDKSTSTYSAT